MKHQFKAKTIHSSYVFNNPFLVVWSVIKDSSLIIDIQANHEYYSMLELNHISSNTSYHQGSTFWFYIGDLLSITYEIQSIIESDYFCSISWLCHLSDTRLPSFTCIYYLHPEGDNQTIFIAKYLLPFFFFQETVIKKEEIKRQLYYNRVDKFISNKEYRKKQTESIILKGNYTKAANIMLNIKQMATLFSTVVNSTSDMTTKDTVIQVKVKTSKLLGYSMILIITVLEIMYSDDSIYLKLSIKDEKSNINSREVITTLNNIGNNQMVFMMKHTYDSPLNELFYQYVIMFKKKLFKSFTKLLNQ